MHSIPFSGGRRPERLAYAAGREFDLVIVGGGITGAGIAREASLAGLRVALFEARDFGSGTSSRSTKLFHGGLRYLERAEFLLVREGGREREGMQRLAPHLVHSLPFLLPIYRNMKYGRFAMGTAVWLYDRLAQVQPDEQRVVLTREEALAREPDISAEGLTGGVLYHEYLTDDARCVVTVLRAAESLGAVAVNYAPVTGLLYESGRVRGVHVRDALSGAQHTVRGTVVVNAAGPWIEGLLREDDRAAGRDSEPRLLHSRGVHLAFAHKRLPLRQALAVQTPDGRLLFMIPRGDRTFVGTTDEAYTGELYHPPIEERDVDYLLDLVNGIFPDAGIGRTDISGQWSGVRPLVLEPGKATKDVSRRDQIWVSDSRLVTIAGGKLTAWRKMAEDAMEKVYDVFAESGYPVNPWLRERAQALSPSLPLPGGLTIPPRSLLEWQADAIRRLAGTFGARADDVAPVVQRYGDEAERVLECAAGVPAGLERIDPDVPLLRGELRYLREFELAVTLSDVVVRRTGLGWFGGPEAARSLGAVAAGMGALYDWDDAERARQCRECQEQSYWTERQLFATGESISL